MKYTEYIKQINFKVLQPSMSVEEWFRSNRELKRPMTAVELEALNTELPVDDSERRKNLDQLLHIPRMSTLAIAAMINKAVSMMPANACFVNVGVWNGFTLLSGMVGNPGKTCIGVDNFSQFGNPRDAFGRRFNEYKSPAHFFYDMDFEEYFRDFHEGLIGAYLYDGEHSYQNQLEGLQVAEPFFSDGCLIFIDDTNWRDPRNATLDFMSRSKNRYDILLDASTCQNHHPTFWNGFMVLQYQRA